MSDTGPKYPACTVELFNTDANAVAIFRKVRRELIRYLVMKERWTDADATREGDAFQAEATSGDYDNVLTTCHRWVNVV